MNYLSNSKEAIRLRFKQLSNGSKSLYLDTYFEGVRHYEYLKLYIVPENSKIDRDLNRQTLELANLIKAKRLIELHNNRYGFTSNNGNINLIDYVNTIAQKKGGDYKSLKQHLVRFRGSKVLFNHINKQFVEDFIYFMKNNATDSRSNKEQKLKPSTQRELYQKFIAVLNSAVKDGIMSNNPTCLIKNEDKIKIVENERDYLTITEIKKLVAIPISNTMVKKAFIFSCLTGLRISDIRQLKWSNITIDNDGKKCLNFKQKKTSTQTLLPLCDGALFWLPTINTEASNDYIFDLPSQTTIRYHIQRWIKKAGIKKDIHFHSARHSFAALLLSLDVDIYVVSKLLGHKEIKTTQIYAKIIDKSKRMAIDKIPTITIN